MCYERVDYGIGEEARRLRSEEERAKRREADTEKAENAEHAETEKDREFIRA